MGKVILNPYQNVNWQQQYKANLHSHTTESDGFHYGSELIRKYKDKNYDVLFITDHDSWGGALRIPRELGGQIDVFTFPWSIFEGDKTYTYPSGDEYPFTNLHPEPKTFNQPPTGTYNYDENTGLVTFPDGYKMATTKGVEMSRGHHINVLFNGPAGVDDVEEEVIQQAQDHDSIIIINHPGRYWGSGKYTTAWYKSLFRDFNQTNLVGIEVYSQNNQYPNDAVLWDILLEEFMPNRVVWGFGNDDVHQTIHEFTSYNFLLLDNFNIGEIRDSMVQGKTYFSNEKTKTGEAKAPRINNISVDNANKTISIVTPNATNIVWYSGVEHGGSKVVGYGNTFDYEGFGGNYVRAELVNDFGTTCTQPFGIEPSENPVPFPKNPPKNPIDKLIEESYVFDAGQWRKIENIYTKDNDGWKKTDFSNYL